MGVTYTKAKIETAIEKHRKELIETGLKHGFNSSETIIASQKLDQFIVLYQKLIK
ncbi:aspartyl-phosphate phosphatase Spo0E family protein [Bacillus sp. V3B]|uniref:aspartyl-phosphate phosphatase Spo0E family protein n=1 Tax=Bacillus sp. V3B TaxID=2804915 RepID=UPI00210CBB52|nr:aspartyl-phosphate phosphatase Spo0E family protein [Bacillus sp. V3B]MCQ6276585.1 aspartyl-phosphate phosphatase Spo0E family protein [Bacillus sp. V3B]